MPKLASKYAYLSKIQIIIFIENPSSAYHKQMVNPSVIYSKLTHFFNLNPKTFGIT